MSPHFYNTMDEIDRVMAEMASIVAKKDYVGGGAGRWSRSDSDRRPP